MKLFTYILFGIALLNSTSSLAVVSPQDTSGLHLEWLDRSVKPGQDFYEFANGTWRKQNPIPAAYPVWSVMATLEERNLQIVRQLIETVAKNPVNPPGSIAQ